MFGGNYGRRLILARLEDTIKDLRSYGVDTVWLDGSFVTTKVRPRDVEVVYEVPAGADNSTWGIYAPTSREKLKRDRKIDLWPYPSPQPSGRLSMGPRITIIEFFSKDRSDVPKGLIRLASESSS